MRALSKTFLLLLATFGLASCGGGGGGTQSAFNATPVDTIAISATSTSIPTNAFTILTVTVKRPDGTVEADGTSINATVTPATMGSITPGSNTLSGGTTTFGFTSGNQTGTATVTISVPAGTNGTTTTATKSIPITITAGSGQDSRVQLSATATTLPASPYSFAQQSVTPFPGNFPGSPYIAEVDITLRHINGQLVTGGTANVSITPTSIAQLSTGSGTQFQTLSGNLAVTAPGGVATVFVHAGNTPGTAVLTVTTTDPDGSGQTVSSQLTITIAGGSSGLPGGITVTSSGPAYVTNSGGQSPTITARVTDGSNALVPNPSGFDNVEFQILTASTDAQLSGTNAAGQSVKGTKIDVATHSGVAAVTLLPGVQQGPVQIKATADRGDNNVDNGIQDPISATVTVVVSDGNLYNLTLTMPGPNANTLLINGVSTDASATVLPTDPNGTYSLTISAKGVDRQGNAVLPGTQIRFGEIDGPLNGFTGANRGQFAISGNDGNPAEGGTLFTAPTGAFTTAGGGAGPGDSLLVFGKLVTGNRDLENARTVRSINSATSLNTVGPFNGNDIDTGATVDSGPVLPYIIGHSLDGNITPSALTNDDGIATVKLTYPVSKLGKLAAVYAQGTGTMTKNAPRTVEDIMFVRFAGVAGVGDLAAAVTASPNPIFGNTTQQVRVCIEDALGSPLQGIQFDFTYTGTGKGTVDNTTGSGLLANLTDESGCVNATVVTSGVQANVGTDGGGALKFCAGSLCATVNVVVNIAVCQVSPASVPVPSSGTSGTIKLTATDSLGNKAAGALITSTCSSSIGTITPASSTATTDTQGVALFPFSASGFVLPGIPNQTQPQGGIGQCTFDVGGKTCATVPFNGIPNACDFSPRPADC